MSAISEIDIRDFENYLLREDMTPYVPGQAMPSKGQGASPVYDTKILQPKQPEKESVRSSVLNEANRIVNGARNQAYGSAEDNFQNIADLWNAYLNGNGLIKNLMATDIANMMALMKIARLKHSPNHRDSWVDIAGYAACGAEIGLK